MSQDSAIDPGKLTDYLKTISLQEQAIVTKIVSVTQYIKHEELVAALKKCIRNLEIRESKYNLYIPEGKIGSEHWLLTLLEDYLNPIGVYFGIKDIRKNLKNTYPIILIDDAIYSSCNMCGIIDSQIRDRTSITNKIYCLVAVSSSLNCQVAADPYFNAEIIADRVMEEYTTSKLLGNDYNESFMYEKFGCETASVLPLYFDHKIANAFGSYQFYHKIIKNPVSRVNIDKIRPEDIKNLVERLRLKVK